MALNIKPDPTYSTPGPKQTGREIILDYLSDIPTRLRGALSRSPFPESPSSSVSSQIPSPDDEFTARQRMAYLTGQTPIAPESSILSDAPGAPSFAWTPKNPKQVGEMILRMQRNMRNEPMVNIFTNLDATRTNRIAKSWLHEYLSDLRDPQVPMHEIPYARFPRPGVQAAHVPIDPIRGDAIEDFRYMFEPQKFEEIKRRYPRPFVLTRDLRNPDDIRYAIRNLAHEGEHRMQDIEGILPQQPLSGFRTEEEYLKFPREVGARKAQADAEKAFLETLQKFRYYYDDPYVNLQDEFYKAFPD